MRAVPSDKDSTSRALKCPDDNPTQPAGVHWWRFFDGRAPQEESHSRQWFPRARPILATTAFSEQLLFVWHDLLCPRLPLTTTSPILATANCGHFWGWGEVAEVGAREWERGQTGVEGRGPGGRRVGLEGWGPKISRFFFPSPVLLSKAGKILDYTDFQFGSEFEDWSVFMSQCIGSKEVEISMSMSIEYAIITSTLQKFLITIQKSKREECRKAACSTIRPILERVHLSRAIQEHCKILFSFWLYWFWLNKKEFLERTSNQIVIPDVSKTSLWSQNGDAKLRSLGWKNGTRMIKNSCSSRHDPSFS